MSKGYEIVLRKGQWEVRFADRRDPELTVAVRQAVTMSGGEPTVMETQRKAVRFLSRFFNFRHRRGEARDAFIKEPFVLGRIRFEALLRKMNFIVAYDTNRLDGSCHVRSDTRSVSELPVWLAATSRFFAALFRLRLRPRASPMKIDGWDAMGAIDRFRLAEDMLGARNRKSAYKGSQYLAKGRGPAPIRIEDARNLKVKILEAGRAANWPRAIFDLVTIIGIEGSRWSSTSPLTAADWARSSRFGRSLWAPNKRSKGVRVFHMVITADAVMQLRQSFDLDPARPNMDELERLLADGDWEALERVFLFPSKTGAPHSYHVFNNDYIRPAVEAAGLLIHGKGGSARPTAHRMRSARIQEGVDRIVTSGRSMEDIEHDLVALQADVFIKSKAAFYRYVGDRMEELGLSAKIERFDAQEARNAADLAAGRTPVTRQEREKTKAEKWLAQIELEELEENE